MGHSFLLQYGPLAARILISALFIVSGSLKVFGFAGIVAYIDSVGLPLATVLAALTILIEIGAGLLLLIGWKAKIASWLLFGFTALTIIFFHNNIGDQLQMTMVLKNLAIMGGLLLFATFGSGPLSVDYSNGGASALSSSDEMSNV